MVTFKLTPVPDSEMSERTRNVHKKIRNIFKFYGSEGENDSGVVPDVEIRGVRTLFDFLSENPDIVDNEECLQNLVRLTEDVTRQLNPQSLLLSILTDYGWNRGGFTSVVTLSWDLEMLRKTLGTLYIYSKRQREALRKHPASGNSKETESARAISSFVPNILLSSLHHFKLADETVSEDARAFMESVQQSFTWFVGVCMLVDISGFTKLSSTFCSRGSSGLDELHAITSGYLGKLVRIVYFFGGDGK